MQRLQELNAETESPNFWSDSTRAQTLMRERIGLENGLKVIDQLTVDLTDNMELLELGILEDDDEIIFEAEAALQAVHQIALKAEK